MSSSGWPMQNKLDGIFVYFCRFLIHAVLFSFLFCLIVIVCERERERTRTRVFLFVVFVCV